MRLITKKFFETSTIEKNKDTIGAMDFLSSPGIVRQMIIATEKHNPALSGVVAELEDRFADCELFPLNHEGEDKNAKNRRNVGWMVRFIMREYGYTPIENSERTRIGSNSGSRFFGNAAVYEKTDEHPNYQILNHTMITSREWTAKDMMISKDDLEYQSTKNRMKNASKTLKKIKMSKDFLVSYLLRTGYNNCISMFDLMMIFKGVKVPCPELCEAIEDALTLFETFDHLDKKSKSEFTRNMNEVHPLMEQMPENEDVNYILQCFIYSESGNVGDTLKNLFDLNSAGLKWKAKSDKFLPLVEYARWQQNFCSKELTITKSNKDELYHFISQLKSIVEKIEEMSKSCIEDEEALYYARQYKDANELLNYTQNNPAKLVLSNYYDMIINNWEGLKGWTITYRFLADLVALERNWKTDENSKYELCKIASEVTKEW